MWQSQYFKVYILDKHLSLLENIWLVLITINTFCLHKYFFDYFTYVKSYVRTFMAFKSTVAKVKILDLKDQERKLSEYVWKKQKYWLSIY